MGVLPLQFLPGESAASLGLDGSETYSLEGLDRGLAPSAHLKLVVTATDGQRREVEVLARVDNQTEIAYLRHGGVLPFVLSQFLQS